MRRPNRLLLPLPIRRSVHALTILIWAVLPGSMTPAAAQDVMSIVAVVNEDVISGLDLEARTVIAIVSSGLADTEPVRRQMQAQVLRKLINESLQRQEAERLNIRVSDGEVQRSIQRVEKVNRMGEGGMDKFLAQNGIAGYKFALEGQLRSEIAWQKLLRRRIRPQVDVGDEEIDEVIQQIEQSRGKAEYQISEIYLAVDSPDQEDEVLREAGRLTDELAQGADFSAIAAQFSQRSTAGTGGDLGWVRKGTIDPQLEKVLAGMRPGQVSPPVRTFDGVVLVWLRDRRIQGEVDPAKVIVKLSQLLLPLQDRTEEHRQARIADAEGLREGLDSCETLEIAARELGGPRSGPIGTFRLSQLSPGVRSSVENLQVGIPSPPIVRSDAIQLLMVCERKEPSNRLPTRDEVRRTLEGQRIDSLARRYLRDLKRNAFIDIRIPLRS